jgi:CRISPR/Cas system CMR-associated protein Cmr3 (group 5 of RAMP superfamily)
MKIVVKESKVEIPVNEEKSPVNEYLVYLMTDDNVSVKCKIAYTEEDMNDVVEGYREVEGLTIPIERVSFSEFNNKELLNEPTYGS